MNNSWSTSKHEIWSQIQWLQGLSHSILTSSCLLLVKYMLCILTSSWVLLITYTLYLITIVERKKKVWKWTKKVFQPALMCTQHPKTGQNTQHREPPPPLRIIASVFKYLYHLTLKKGPFYKKPPPSLLFRML